MRRPLFALAIGLLSSACGSTPTGPSNPPPPVTQLSLTCPASTTVGTPNASVPVSYTLATSSGGVAPVTIGCSPASGTSFVLGSTPVNCTATDNVGNSAACMFSVVVKLNVSLKGTTFLAFGDSLTEGQVLTAFNVKTIIPSLSYPSRLRLLLDARYTTQTVSMLNFGVSGEEITSETTRPRLNSLLTQFKPDAVMILEGANDLLAYYHLDGDKVIDRSLLEMGRFVQDSFQKGAKAVFLAGWPPQIPGKKYGIYSHLVPGINTRIQAVAAQQGAVYVDLYNPMLGSINSLISSEDGLHPTAAGYQAMADVFFTSIKANFEQTIPVTFSRPR
jgi:lysophospholipase L1-like esterase